MSDEETWDEFLDYVDWWMEEGPVMDTKGGPRIVRRLLRRIEELEQHLSGSGTKGGET